MPDSRRTNTRDERVSLAKDAAAECAAFWQALRDAHLPAAAAQAMAEAYTAGVVARDDEPREPWMP